MRLISYLLPLAGNHIDVVDDLDLPPPRRPNTATRTAIPIAPRESELLYRSPRNPDQTLRRLAEFECAVRGVQLVDVKWDDTACERANNGRVYTYLIYTHTAATSCGPWCPCDAAPDAPPVDVPVVAHDLGPLAGVPVPRACGSPVAANAYDAPTVPRCTGGVPVATPVYGAPVILGVDIPAPFVSFFGVPVDYVPRVFAEAERKWATDAVAPPVVGIPGESTPAPLVPLGVPSVPRCTGVPVATHVYGAPVIPGVKLGVGTPYYGAPGPVFGVPVGHPVGTFPRQGAPPRQHRQGAPPVRAPPVRFLDLI